MIFDVWTNDSMILLRKLMYPICKASVVFRKDFSRFETMILFVVPSLESQSFIRLPWALSLYVMIFDVWTNDSMILLRKLMYPICKASVVFRKDSSRFETMILFVVPSLESQCFIRLPWALSLYVMIFDVWTNDSMILLWKLRFPFYKSSFDFRQDFSIFETMIVYCFFIEVPKFY